MDGLLRAGGLLAAKDQGFRVYRVGLFAGALIVETVFGYPGMGYLTVNAITQNDYTVIMGTTLIYAALLIVGNLLADLLYPVVDPRLRG